MPANKIVVLDGSDDHDQDLAPILGVLLDLLERHGAQVQRFRLREMKLAHCLGCFGCWLKTPGIAHARDPYVTFEEKDL